MRWVPSVLLSSAILSLTACSPTFQSTSQQCEAILPTTQVAQSFEVNAPSASGEYQLYMQDFLNSLKDVKALRTGASEPDAALTNEEQAVIDFITSKVNEYLNYETDENGNIISANNPLDYVESLMATVEESEILLTFSEAKEALVRAINGDSAICNYRNDQIVFQREETIDGSEEVVDRTFVALNLTYIPTNFVEADDLKVDQIFTMTFDPDPNDTGDDPRTFFSSISRYQPPENFPESGYAQANVRQLSISQEDSFQSFFFDDDFDTSLQSVMQVTETNEYCQDDDRNITPCADDANIRQPKHKYCRTGEEENEDFILDETNQVTIHDFSINNAGEDFTNLKRFRVEIDYATQQMEVFVSKFNNAIVRAVSENDDSVLVDQFNPDLDSEVIYDFTSCESSAVSKERFDSLSEADQEEFPDGIAPTIYVDPGFDTTYELDEFGQQKTDEETGELLEETAIAPTPIMTFQLDQAVTRTSVSNGS